MRLRTIDTPKITKAKFEFDQRIKRRGRHPHKNREQTRSEGSILGTRYHVPSCKRQQHAGSYREQHLKRQAPQQLGNEKQECDHYVSNTRYFDTQGPGDPQDVESWLDPTFWQWKNRY